MIREALAHLPGLGPRRLRILQECGVRNWLELMEQPRSLIRVSPTGWERLQRAVEACETAVARQDLPFLCDALHPIDKWRILASYGEAASYFDLETTGLTCDAQITVIACRHRGELQVYTRGNNLDDFLDLLDDVELLVSFNGNSFDVPQVKRHFHVPALPCAHLDLRWICYHAGFQGGLKEIEGQLGIRRPADLVGVDGAEAVALWYLWEQTGNRQAIERLIRYCCADTLALDAVATRMNCMKMELPEVRHAMDCADLWAALNTVAVELHGRSQGPRPADRHPLPAGAPSPRTDLRDRLRSRLRTTHGRTDL